MFKNNPRDSQSLSNNTVYHVILIDYKGVMWDATDGGLNRVTPGTENGVPKFSPLACFKFQDFLIITFIKFSTEKTERSGWPVEI